MNESQTGAALLQEDLVEIMLEIEGREGADKKAQEAFTKFGERLKNGMALLLSRPEFRSFFSAGLLAAGKSSETLQERLALTDEQMAEMYEYGASLYAEGAYVNASDVLMCLCMCNPFIAGFWKALGLSQEKEGDYRGAILSYAVALEKDDDLMPALFTARCLGHLGNRAEALEILDQAQAMAQQPSVDHGFTREVNKIRTALA